MNRTEWGGESIRLYIRGNVFSNDVRRLFSVVSCLPRRRQRRMERSRGGRDGSRWKETAQGPAPFFFWPSYCGSLLHAGCPRPAKGLSQPWNEANARCRLRSPPRERNTLSGEVERQKVTDDRLLVNPVMALPLTIIIGWQGQRAQKTLQPLFHAGARTMERIENRSYVSLVTRLNWIERVSVDGKREGEKEREREREKAESTGRARPKRAPEKRLSDMQRAFNSRSCVSARLWFDWIFDWNLIKENERNFLLPFTLCMNGDSFFL